MNRRHAAIIFFFVSLHVSAAQPPAVTKIEPPNWWAGMTLDTVQLMVYGEHLKDFTASTSSPALKVLRIHELKNSSYAFIDLEILPSALPGDYVITLSSGGGSVSVHFPLNARRRSPAEQQGFCSSDVIYLITPDRFANGDTTNDSVPDMKERARPHEPFGRHGGDIQGIISKLDYLRGLGVTALWINPLVENNMERGSYHGYSATNLYRIDPRFGTNELYRLFAAEAHKRGLKVIMDHVNNHIGTNHPWIQNLPEADWLNGTPADHQKPFHSKTELDDIHSDSLTKQRATHGWFDGRLADLNQANPFLARYLLQNTIWWIEESGIDGIREDTYPYIDPQFREWWCSAVMKEYPKFNIVGEVWVEDPAFLAPYQHGSPLRRKIPSELPAVTDFGLYGAMMKAFVDSSGSVWEIFNCLAKDFLYSNPDNLVTFLDNHDIRRIMFKLAGDEKKLKLALTTLLTVRGIPELLYGTEIGMKGGTNDGTLRADFPGGFPNDARDAFTGKGRTKEENDIFRFTEKLLKIRGAHPALQTGTFTHFKPANEVYVYFRTTGSERIMVVINHNPEKQTVDLSPFAFQLRNGAAARDLMRGTEINIAKERTVDIEGMSAGIFEIIPLPK